MHTITKFSSRHELDSSFATTISEILINAISQKGSASIAVSGGSTPKGLFERLSKIKLDWSKVLITLADERWVPADSKDSNTKLVHENLLQNEAASAKFFHLKQGDDLNSEILNTLNIAAKVQLLPLDVLILGMGEDGHTASLFPCSEQIEQGLLSDNDDVLLKVVPQTAPHDRISFTFSALAKSENIFLHLSGESKEEVLNTAISGSDVYEMPIRAFLNHESLETQVYWAP